MLYNYIALVVFVLFGIFMPSSFLLASKLLRNKVPGNPVKNAPYESGEKSIGSSRDLDNEYISYFALFLPFELVAIYMIFWAPAARLTSAASSYGILASLLVSSVLAIIGYKIMSDKNV
ncbi:MAG: NADH-quinone oxidoreductase subunit A [Candidatus Micrarchaeaceae archaeon]